MMFEPGMVVRLKHDPGRTGTITKNSRTQGGKVHYQVQFASGFDYVPEDQLEAADAAKDPLDLLAAGTLSPASDLRRVLTHARLSGRLADVIYSLETTRTDFYPHQFKPVLKLLSNVSDGLLIADEVGLGKTIEAGLIWTELRTRFDYQRLFVLCPAVLRDKWRRELAFRFGVRADLCDAGDACERLEQAARDPFSESFALIGSIQGLRPRGEEWEEAKGSLSPSQRLARLLTERGQDEPIIDLLVIDEAHHMRNPETSNSAIGKLLRAVANHVVLLTATPVNLKSDDLYSLMRLIDADTFTSIGEFEDILRANGPLVHARDIVLRQAGGRDRLIELLLEARSHPILSGSRTLQAILDDPPSDEDLEAPRTRATLAAQLDQANLLGQVINRTRKRDVHENRVQREAVPQAVKLSAREMDYYERVTQVVRDYCQRQGTSEGFLLTTPQRQMASSIPASFRYWSSRLAAKTQEPDLGLEDEDDELANHELNVDESTPIGSLVRELVQRVGSLGSYHDLRREDSKYGLLLARLREYVAGEPTAKLVLFSSFRATLSYLDERLREDGIATLLMTGDTRDKDDVIEQFRTFAGAVVLLSSEVGSEGVDLQFSRIVVNYDLPWNPMRVEQRIGRLDRLGQTANKVLIWNLFCADTIDQRIYERLYLRIGVFEHSLGSLEPILGREIQELTRELMTDQLSPAQESERIDATAIAIENRQKMEDELEENAGQLFALGDYLLEQVHAARELGRRISDLDLRNYIVEYLRRYHPGSRCVQEGDDSLVLTIRLDTTAKLELEAFLKRQRGAGLTRLAAPGTTAVRCVFRNNTAANARAGEEVINQFHPLVRCARDRLREAEADLRLAVAASVPSVSVAGRVGAGVYAFAVERWAISGERPIERLAYEATGLDGAGPLDPEDAERLVHAAASEGSDWFSAVGELSLGKVALDHAGPCLERLEERFRDYRQGVEVQNHDRVDALLRTFERRFAGELERLKVIEARHTARGRSSLAAATRGRIEKLGERAKMRRLKLAGSKQVTAERTLFLMGVVQVVP